MLFAYAWPTWAYSLLYLALWDHGGAVSICLGLLCMGSSVLTATVHRVNLSVCLSVSPSACLCTWFPDIISRNVNLRNFNLCTKHALRGDITLFPGTPLRSLMSQRCWFQSSPPKLLGQPWYNPSLWWRTEPYGFSGKHHGFKVTEVKKVTCHRSLISFKIR